MTFDTILLETFGHSSLKPEQEFIISRSLSGTSSLGVFPTGSGKSLCFQATAYALYAESKKLSIVISPLLSLIKDQLIYLESIGISAASLNSSHSLEQKKQIIADIRDKKITLLYLAPETFISKETTQLLTSLKNTSSTGTITESSSGIGIIAIDEAHCISEWGHSFRPSYLKVAKTVNRLKPHATIALTATATIKVTQNIRSAFKITAKDSLILPIERPNLIYQVIPTTKDQKNKKLLEKLSQHEKLPAIVYVMRQIDAEEVNAFLQSSNINSRSYHAGMDTKTREHIQTLFLENKIDVMVATIAFGMGVNKQNVRSVIHYHLPKSPEGWSQESGRAGRDGKLSECITLACGDDITPLQNFITAEKLSDESIRRVVERFFSEEKESIVSNFWWCVDLHLSESQLHIIIAHLTNQSYITHTHDSWRYAKISKRHYSTRSVKTKKEKRIDQIINATERIDTLLAKEQWNISRKKLTELIREIESNGDILISWQHKLRHYKINKHPDNIKGLVDSIILSFQKHHIQNSARLNKVLDIAQSSRCIVRELSNYFQSRSMQHDCEKCSACAKKTMGTNKRKKSLPQLPKKSLNQDDLELIHTLMKKHGKILNTSMKAAKFLCGIYSMHLRYHRLIFDDHYGHFSDFSLEDMDIQVSQIV